MLPWLLRFLRASMPKATAAGAAALAPLLARAGSAWERRWAALQCEALVRREGCLYLYRDAPSPNDFDLGLRARHGVRQEMLSPAEVARLEPALAPLARHGVFFPEAMQGGWIQALHYYYGRQQASQRIWQHWTRMDEEWRMQKPAVYPTFDQWQREIANASTPTTASSQYVEWEAFALWVRSLVEAAREVPAIVQGTLEERCPGFLARVRAARAKPCSDPQWLWDQLRRWIEEHAFAEAICDSSIDSVRADAHRQLRSERVVDYWTVVQARMVKEELPTFEQWLAGAAAFDNCSIWPCNGLVRMCLPSCRHSLINSKPLLVKTREDVNRSCLKPSRLMGRKCRCPSSLCMAFG